MPAFDNVVYGSKTVNGQLGQVFEWPAFRMGNAVGPAYAGGPASPYTIPPHAVAASSGSQSAASAAANPWSLKSSALPVLIIMLIIGVLGLRYIHWGK